MDAKNEENFTYETQEERTCYFFDKSRQKIKDMDKLKRKVTSGIRTRTVSSRQGTTNMWNYKTTYHTESRYKLINKDHLSKTPYSPTPDNLGPRFQPLWTRSHQNQPL